MSAERGGGAAGKTVAIVGAGIVGVSAAIWLQRSGHSVIMIDRKGAGEGASFGNGGVLASCSIVPITRPGLPLRAPSMLLDPDAPLFLRWSYLPRLSPWLMRYLARCTAGETRRIAAALAPVTGGSLEEHQALAAGTGAERWVVASDYLFAYRDRAAFERDSFAWGLRRDHGYSWDEVEGAAVRRLDPLFSDAIGFVAGVGGHGHVADPGRYVKDLAAHAERAGARMVVGEVEDVALRGGAVAGVVVSGETIPADAVILTAGAWSPRLAERLGIKVPLETERGYHVELVEPSAMPRAPAMIAAGQFVVVPMAGRVRLAGIVEFGGLEAPPSRKPVELLLRHIRRVMPALSWKSVREWMGHRPVAVDSLPFIGEIPGAAGAYAGFGHHHVGLTAGPRTGRLLADLVSGRRPNIDLSPYRPDRFT